MASSDDKADSSVLIDSLKSNQNGNALSPEEVAWVDSCIVKDPDVSDGDWSYVKDALLEIIGLGTESHNSSAPESDGLSKGTDIEMLSSAEPGIVKFSRRLNEDDFIQTNDVMDESSDDVPIKEETFISLLEQLQGDPLESSLRNVFLPHYGEGNQNACESIDLGLGFSSSINETEPSTQDSSLRNVFLPHYREGNQNVSESIDLGLGFSSSINETEPSTQDIFKVWDLGIPSEEDELDKQLKKALSENSAEFVPSMADDSGALKDLRDKSVDDLVAGFSDLSLNRHSK